ncbi:hypothetical protein Cs7R123_62480 [Catellatospora sp. TT07R-123]|uniref:hypothetical protein n=1 Tax=Catellatospora sp. TT07R-123 TaxID=2733863 RepID=UPI001B1336DC|nr:hypothetical protein [Catellatospora sp. TT07R-123]GHJ48906.1 hypothetical protein Cs7R123_62480 [Catellatospora sp. TT07R-123]
MQYRHGGLRWAAAAAVSLATAATVLTGTPAQASLLQLVRADSVAYTDSREPNTAHVDVPGDAPVGAWRDEQGKKHTSRSYFTFDLSAFRGRQLKSAYAIAQEVAVTDCDKQRRVEVWRTAPVTAQTTWRNPPAELAKLGEFTVSYFGCPSGYLEVGALDAVRDALARPDAALTIELKIPADSEGNPHLGRTFARGFGISIDSNAAPFTPTALKVDQSACGGPAALLTSSRGPVLSAQTSDPDVNETGGSDSVYATFALWPVADPSARREYPEVGPITNSFPKAQLFLPYGALTDGTYAFQVKARDADSETGWSAECRFTVDTVRPAGVPTVTSTDYPENTAGGGGGIPGRFTFSLPGVSDLGGFLYGLGYATTYVAAAADGTATVTVTPSQDGPASLHVLARDRAGNFSDERVYQFYVNRTAPDVEDLDPQAWVGQPHRIVFRPQMAGVVSYAYTVNNGPEQTVAAAADGTAQIAFTPQDSYTELRVRSVTAAGWRSSEGWLPIMISTAPTVSSAQWPSSEVGAKVGTTGTFTFRPQMAGVTEYVWTVDDVETGTAAAGPDGTAAVTWTATASGWHYVTVYSRTADGTESELGYYEFQVDTTAPVIDAGVPPYQYAGVFGQPITFRVSPREQGAVSYSYRVEGATDLSVTAAADGTAVITWTPTDTAVTFYTLQVRAIGADGTPSEAAYFGFYVR